MNLGSSEGKDYRGSAICHLGDLDGNGVDDVAVGAYGCVRAVYVCLYV